MTWMITETVDFRGAGKTFYLYDTFSGFDPKYSSEADFPDAPHVYGAIDRAYKAPDIEQHVRQRFRDKQYIVITKGVVPDVLAQLSPRRVAFLHLDMNSPRAETGALEVLLDRIAARGHRRLRRLRLEDLRTQKEAADDFMAARGQVILELPTGQGLMIKREGPPPSAR